MKKLILILLVSSFVCLLTAQTETEPVDVQIGNMYVDKDLSFDEVSLFGTDRLEVIVSENPYNAEAWLWYYEKARKDCYSPTSNEISKSELKTLESITEEMVETVPESFAFHYSTYLNGNYHPSNIGHLETAKSLAPDNALLADKFAYHGEITNNKTVKNEALKDLMSQNQFSPGVLEYNYNVLNSLQPNAVLVTNGDDDTLPLWILQDLQSVRKDVQIINLKLLHLEDYVNMISEKTGIQLNTQTNNSTAQRFRHLKQKSNGQILYLALTLPPDILKENAESIYVEGLAFRYSNDPLNNINSLVYNWENLFHKDYIVQPCKINRNYFLPLLTLYDHYKIYNAASSLEIKNILTQLAYQTSNPELILGKL